MRTYDNDHLLVQPMRLTWSNLRLPRLVEITDRERCTIGRRSTPNRRRELEKIRLLQLLRSEANHSMPRWGPVPITTDERQSEGDECQERKDLRVRKTLTRSPRLLVPLFRH